VQLHFLMRCSGVFCGSGTDRIPCLMLIQEVETVPSKKPVNLVRLYFFFFR